MLALNKRYERELVKFNRFLLGTLIFVPCASYGAGDAGFNMAAQLLSAARNGNTRLVQNLINSGADVNYVDSTGVSVVCTAVMNNDTRAVQVLQMYGADASQCDRQIKNYRARNNPTADSGLFAGLPSTHKLVLTAAGVGVVIAGLLWATDAFDSSNGNSTSSSGGSHGSGSGGGSSGGGSSLTPAFTVPYGPAMVTSTGVVNEAFDYTGALDMYSSGGFQNNFNYMNANGNYLLMMHGYAPFARGYLGQTTLRYPSSRSPVPSAVYGAAQFGSDANTKVTGGIPVNVALVTANGINVDENTSLADKFLVWSTMNNSTVNDANNEMISSKYFNNVVQLGGGTANSLISDDSVTEDVSFDFSGNGTAIGIAIENTDANAIDDLLAKIVGGNTSATDGDFTGFIPNGQMTIYRTGGGKDASGDDVNYYNYRALADAATRGFYVTNATTSATDTIGVSQYGRAKISVVANLDVIEPLYDSNAYTIEDFFEDVEYADYQTEFYSKVGSYYGNGVVTPVELATPAASAQSFFSGLGVDYFPLTVFSVGGVQTDSDYSGAYKMATFENIAPLAFSGANKLFMSVVAVNLPTGSTASATSVSGFTTTQKYSLSQWQLGTGDDATYYKSRICGISGTGNGSVDPWCFAAAGATDEQATAAAAGAAGAVKAAFSYLTNQQVFTLLALTADGAYLGTNPSTGVAWASTDDLVSYLSSMYILPNSYQTKVNNNLMTYLEAFKEVYGYGLINLERATTPGKSVYYYTNGKIVSANGNAYWRSAQNSTARSSSVFGARGAVIPVSFYDVLTDTDNTISVPRVWNMDLSFGNDASRGFYLGDTLAELKTHEVDNTVSFGNFKFGFARSERYYDDNMNGLDNLSLSYENSRFGLASNYQHYLTDGAGRFGGLANPVLSLVSNAVTSGAEFKSGRFALSARGFSGVITNEYLLENDPAVSNNFAAAKLGDVMGAESGIKFNGEKLSLQSNIGTMHENGTVLGSQFIGLLNINAADTHYIDTTLGYNVNDNLKFTLRGTLAWTRTNDVANDIINGISELKSNAFAAGVRFGNFDISASMPLALTDGALQYSYANFIVDENDNLQMRDAGVRDLDLTPEYREYRFNLAYRHKFGDWTDGAFGLIYRIHPNNTDAFGNESIFMMKLSHRLGI